MWTVLIGFSKFAGGRAGSGSIRIPAAALLLIVIPAAVIAISRLGTLCAYMRSHSGALRRGTALLCTTQAVAIGAIRALHEYGIQVGKDVSVCAINDDGISRYLCPSLTCFQLPENLIGYLRLCVEWMLRDKQKWDGPLKFQADGDNLFIGESTNILQTATDKTKP